MRKTISGAILSLATLILLCASVFAQSDTFYAVEDIYPGLKGIGKTVIEGTRIDQFDIEVIDVIPQGGFDGGPLILIRATGPVVDFSDGIAAGYSGSPVYFGGKLAGAISYGIPGTDTHICGITPIRSMLKALDSGDSRDYSANSVLPPSYTQFSTGPGGPVIPVDSPPAEDKKSGKEKEDESPENEAVKAGYFKGASKVIVTDKPSFAAEMNRSRIGSPESSLFVTPLSSKLLIKGISEKTISQLQPIFDANPKLSAFTAVQSSSGAGPRGFGLLKDKGDARKLQPGDALGVALVTGDFDITGIGTLTYVDGQNRVLAFGHSLFSQGKINIPFGKAYIAYTYGELYRGFKDGYMLNQLGTLTYDHLASVGGVIGTAPDMVDVRVALNDIDRRVTRNFDFQVIRDETLFETLIYTVTTMSFSEFLDRDGGGTIKIGYKIESDEFEAPFERENYFYDKYNAVTFLAAEALPTTALILFNNYREIKINRFTVSIDITSNRVNASIDKAEIVEPPSKDEPARGKSEPEKDGGKDEEKPAPDIDSDGKGAARMQEGEMPTPPITAPEDGKMPPDYKVKEFMPGEIVRVKVTLQPYRSDSIDQELTIRIPRDFPEGQTTLIVQGGGGLVSIYNEYGGKGTILFPMQGGALPLGPGILEVTKALELIKKGEKNNQLMVFIPKPPTPEEQQAEAQGLMGHEVQDMNEKMVKVTVPMDYVIYDMYMIPINIVKKKSGVK